MPRPRSLAAAPTLLFDATARIRPQCSRFSLTCPQCRSIKLYATAMSKTTLGQHKILPFARYDPPLPRHSNHRIALVKRSGVADGDLDNLSLEQVSDYVKPGYMIYPTEQMDETIASSLGSLRETKPHEHLNTYAVLELGKGHVPQAKSKYIKAKLPATFRSLAALKYLVLKLGAPVEFFKLQMERAHSYLRSGHPVEMSTLVGKETGTKKQRPLRGDEEMWDYVYSHYPHLRPDFILQAMPEGSWFMIKPFSDAKRVVWVMACKPPTADHNRVMRPDRTGAILRMQERLERGIELGRVSQLPMRLRAEVADKGANVYLREVAVARKPTRKAVQKEEGGQSNLAGDKTKDHVLQRDKACVESMATEAQPKASLQERSQQADEGPGRIERAEGGQDERLPR